MTDHKLQLAINYREYSRDATHWLELHEDQAHFVITDIDLLPDHVIEEVRSLAIRLMQEYQQEMDDKLAAL